MAGGGIWGGGREQADNSRSTVAVVNATFEINALSASASSLRRLARSSQSGPTRDKEGGEKWGQVV
jgi:hypothetical protein